MAAAPAAPRPAYLRGSWRTYTPADGLAAFLVEHIAEDLQGALWFATTSGGVSIFDGDRFTTFTAPEQLPSDQVYGLVCDRDGRVWLGTRGGGVCWYEGGAFHRFAAGTWCAHGDFPYLFEDGDGRVWFAGGGGVGYWDGHTPCDLSAAYRQSCGSLPYICWGIAQDAAGLVWFGGEDLVSWDGVTFSRCGPEAWLDPPTEPGYFAVARDGDGVLWVGKNGRLWSWDGSRFAPSDAGAPGGVRKLQTDREGRLWVCTIASGVLVHDHGTLHALTAADGMPHPTVTSACQDHTGQFWFSTWGGGVSCLDPSGCHTPAAPGPPHAPAAHSLVAAGPGKVQWAGMVTGGAAGPVQVRVGTCTADSRQERLLDLWANRWYPPVLAATGDGGLWIGTSQGLYRDDGQRCVEVYPAGRDAKPATVTALTVDARGVLHFACRLDQLFVMTYDGREFRRWCAGTLPGQVTALVPGGDGSWWLGLGPLVQGQMGAGGGLARLAADGSLRRWTAADGLADDRVMDLALDGRGVLWIATLGGLSCLDGTWLRSFGRVDGLAQRRLLCLSFDRRGRLWLGAEGALEVFDGTAFQCQWLPQVGTIHDLVEDEAGALWLATDRGLRCYTPQRVSPRARVCRVAAEQLGDGVAEVRLRASVPQVEFECQGLSLRTPAEGMVYRYRLRGHDRDWQPPTKERRARYPQLPVGEYLFEAQAVDRDLNYSGPAQVQVTVEPDPHLAGLTEALSAAGPAGDFVGVSASVRRVLEQLRQAAATDATVLMLGETGTGKGLAARALHGLSQRRGGPFITVSCGALPEGLVESELFGHERGAFTGAVQRKLGKVELAAQGTLFLDEIGDLPLAAQVKLLRLLEEGSYERVGGTKELGATARLVAATNRDLTAMVAAGSFREDLYYRLEVLVIRVPPLRERREDIELLALYFLHRTTAHLHKVGLDAIRPEALTLLQEYAWPGNVRELEHVVQRGAIVGQPPALRAEDIVLVPAGPARPAADGIVPMQEQERRYLLRVLEHTGWQVYGPRGAAQLLGIPPGTLYSRMRKLQITRP